MTKFELDNITNIVKKYKVLKIKKDDYMLSANTNLEQGLWSHSVHDYEVNNFWKQHLENEVVIEYNILIKRARNEQSFSAILHEIYNTVWGIELNPLRTFQITWDTKNSEQIKNEALRLELAILILKEDPSHHFYQPTESTIVFNSRKGFVYWQSELQHYIEKMYFTLIECFENSLLEERRKDIDLTELRDKALKKIQEDEEIEILTRNIERRLKNG